MLKLKKRKKKKESTVKPGVTMFYKMSDTEKEWVVAMAISRGGKKSGSISNYWNVKNLRSGAMSGLNLDEVDWIKEDASMPHHKK